MKEAPLDCCVDPLREMLARWEDIVNEYKRAYDRKAAVYACDVFPVEVLASFGLLVLRDPLSPCAQGCGVQAAHHRICEPPWDFYISPRQCGCARPISVGRGGAFIAFDVPSGWGEEAAEVMHGSLDAMLRGMGFGGIEEMQLPWLQSAAGEYDRLRRLVRGICSVRNEKPPALSNDALFVVFKAAASLPPPLVADHLAELLEALNAATSVTDEGPRARGMACGGVLSGGGVIDAMESAGCLIAEDDFCNGRRQFDISLNIQSNYLYYELLDAATYRPLCPSARGAEERFELLYKMLGGYGIEFVAFIEDTMCAPGREALEYLRVRLMRSGVDPVRLRSAEAREAMERYLASIR